MLGPLLKLFRYWGPGGPVLWVNITKNPEAHGVQRDMRQTVLETWRADPFPRPYGVCLIYTWALILAVTMVGLPFS